jgi:Leishmanolysin
LEALSYMRLVIYLVCSLLFIGETYRWHSLTLQNVFLMLRRTGIGTLWERKNVTGPETSNCPYYGPRANAEYKNITGCDVVPTENSGTINDGTFCGHWDEECMKSELMTGFLNGGLNPLSRITIATLADLGYTVDYSTAESYGRNDVNSTCTCGGRRLLSESTKLNTANQLGTSHISTRRRSLSEEGYQGAVNYGQAILLQRRLAKKVSILANSIVRPDDIVYVGDKVLVVFVEEDGAFFDVTVTL